ncbi:probable beta-D-xylosidase 7 [Lingula anatina]|uniref:Probable beta-D-xylosidase 7 n=1 Tax=Lingula anatina TaxID=7574 RepID=A0A1S3IAN5_LINAN|nr:probable beta-D-xylosidase 7 [Lingula anatina]|eukprot:XP_013395228.1 probable beta-D-xylosidase 7 [Lingula anatina]
MAVCGTAAVVFWFLFSSILPLIADFPFRNTSLSWEDRVNDLVDRLTIDELTLQMASGGRESSGQAPGIPRLGIHPYMWTQECLHGVVHARRSTSFPQSLGLAAAFSPELIYNVSRAIGMEVRAVHNNHTKYGQYGDDSGLSCFSPVVNIMRHPLWGRNQETYGEDPYLTSVYTDHYVRGLQGDHPRYVLASAGCKHFDAYSGPENSSLYDSEISERDWHLTYLPAFKQCVKSGSLGFMCSYNKVNGIPSCVNSKMLDNILRQQWGYKGYVISDMGALEFIISVFGYYNNTVDTAAASIMAGTNLELPHRLAQDGVFMSIPKAVSAGKLTFDIVKEKAKPLFYTRMRLGEFDPPELNPYSKVDISVVQSLAHRELAVQAAVKSFVLLKNTDKFLPFQRTFESIAVIGPMANNTDQLFGDYSGNIDTSVALNPLQALRTKALYTKFTAGCKDTGCEEYNNETILETVSKTQIIFLCLGTGAMVETEGKDRTDLQLPGNQPQLLKDVMQAANGIPIVLLLFNAGPLEISAASLNDRVPVILECFFPGQATGEALRRVLWLEDPKANPAGRLPNSWPTYLNQVPSIYNYSMAGRTYRYFEGSLQYPFGYGLSYTTFSYTTIGVWPQTVLAGGSVSVTVGVTNTGMYDGDEVIQLYISWPDTKEKMPRVQLVGFKRIFIKSLQEIKYKFTITADQMAVWNETFGFLVEPGIIQVYAGGQQPMQSSASNNILSASFKVVK